MLGEEVGMGVLGGYRKVVSRCKVMWRFGGEVKLMGSVINNLSSRKG